MPLSDAEYEEAQHIQLPKSSQLPFPWSRLPASVVSFYVSHSFKAGILPSGISTSK